MTTNNRFSRRPTSASAAAVTGAASAPATEEVVNQAAPEHEEVVETPVDETDVITGTDADVPSDETEGDDYEDEVEEQEEQPAESAQQVTTPAPRPFRRPSAAVQQQAQDDSGEETEEVSRKPLVQINRGSARKEKETTQKPTSLVSLFTVKRGAAKKEFEPAKPGEYMTAGEFKSRFFEKFRALPDMQDIQKSDTDKILKFAMDYFVDTVMEHPLKVGPFLINHKKVPARFHAAPISPNVTFIPEHEIITTRVNKTELLNQLDKTVLVPDGNGSYTACSIAEDGSLVADADRNVITENYLASKADK